MRGTERPARNRSCAPIPEVHGQHQQEPGHSSVLLPTHASPIWVSLHNFSTEQLVECGSVLSTGFLLAPQLHLCSPFMRVLPSSMKRLGTEPARINP